MCYVRADFYRNGKMIYSELWDDLQPMTEAEAETFISKCSEFNIRGMWRILTPVHINSSFAKCALSINDPHDVKAMKIRRRSWSWLQVD